MKIQSNVFLEEAAPAIQFCDNNPIVPITGALLIEPHPTDKNLVVVYSAKHTGWVSCKVSVMEQPVSPICVNGADLKRILKTLPGEAEIKLLDGTVSITQGRSAYTIPAEDATTFPKICYYSDNKVLDITAQDMLDALAIVGPIAKYWDLRPGLSGLFFIENYCIGVDANFAMYGIAYRFSGKASSPFVIRLDVIDTIRSACKNMEPSTNLSVFHQNDMLTISALDSEINVCGYGSSFYDSIKHVVNRAIGAKGYTVKGESEMLKGAISRVAIFGPRYIKVSPSADGLLFESSSVDISDPAFSKHSTAEFVADIDHDNQQYPLDLNWHYNHSNFISGLSRMGGTVTMIIPPGRETTTIYNEDQSIVFFIAQMAINEQA